jgi:hypothetical protein
MGTIFVPKLWAIWNEPLLAWQWRLIALVCIVLAWIQPAVLLWLVWSALDKRFLKQLTEVEQQLAEFSANESVQPIAANGVR